jgi:hypothetical protein
MSARASCASRQLPSLARQARLRTGRGGRRPPRRLRDARDPRFAGLIAQLVATCFRTFRASASVLRQPHARPCIRDRTESSMWSMWRPTDDQVRESFAGGQFPSDRRRELLRSDTGSHTRSQPAVPADTPTQVSTVPTRESRLSPDVRILAFDAVDLLENDLRSVGASYQPVACQILTITPSRSLAPGVGVGDPKSRERSCRRPQSALALGRRAARRPPPASHECSSSRAITSASVGSSPEMSDTSSLRDVASIEVGDCSR